MKSETRLHPVAGRLPTPSASATRADKRPGAIARSKLAEAIDKSPQAAAQRTLMSRIQGSTPVTHVSSQVVQARFDEASVEKALAVASGPSENMGGSTGGAYKITTGVEDADLDPLVVKVAGSSRSALASQIGVEIGVATPNSVLIKAEPKTLSSVARVDSNLAEKLGAQSRFEVQQYASWGKTPNTAGKPYPRTDRVLGRVAVFDALTGNHDRLYSTNEENMAGPIAIDNTVREDSHEARAMMRDVIEALRTSNGELIGYVKNNIGRFGTGRRNAYGGSDTEKIQGLTVQLEMLRQADAIKEKSRAVRGLIDAFDAQEKEKTKADITELLRLASLSKPDMTSPAELVIQRIMVSEKMTRADVIKGNIESKTKSLSTATYAHMLERLSTIETIDFGPAIAETERAITALKEPIERSDREKLARWQERRLAATDRAKAAWKKKFWKFYTNEQAYVENLMQIWRNSDPEPVATRF